MALTYGDVSAITEKYFVPKLIDNIFASNALLQRAKNKWYDRVEGGEKCLVPVMYAVTAGGAWYAGDETLSTAATDQITALEFDWKYANVPIVINHTDEIRNKGKAAIVDMVAAKVQTAEKTLAHNLGTGIFNDGTTDAKALIGLKLAVDSAGTYGGLSRTTYTWHAGQEDGTTTALSIAAMQSLYGDCTVGNDSPTIIVTTQDIWDDYHGLLQPQMRFQDTETANGGFRNLMFNKSPIVVDSHCSTYYMYMLNEDYLSLKVLKGDDFRFEKFLRPVNQATSVARIYWSGALTSSNSRMHGKFTALA